MKYSTIVSAFCFFALLSTNVQAEMDDHGAHCKPEAIMQVGDFDGNGIITKDDIALLEAYKDRGDYAAFFDMNIDGKLNGLDVSIVAKNLGKAGTLRDAQIAALFAGTESFRDIRVATAAGYIPYTPDAYGHGIHFGNMDLLLTAGQHEFAPGKPEGLNYTADGRLVAAYYLLPAAIDLYDFGNAPIADTFYFSLPIQPTFDGVTDEQWHNHTGACFGAVDTCPLTGFDQCMTKPQCLAAGGQIYNPKFHMLHVWLYELNECGPFAGIDEDISVNAPHEPNHGACNLQDVVPFVVNEPHIEPMGFTPNACYDR